MLRPGNDPLRDINRVVQATTGESKLTNNYNTNFANQYHWIKRYEL